MEMIYCVEDDIDIRNMIIYTLEASGFEAKGFNDGKELEKGLKDGIPELILLDLMLPGDDGITILTKLRKDIHTEGIPVIIATAKGGEYDKVIGLDTGADDYLVKPFGMMEMVSRVKAVLRRSGHVSTKVLTMKDLVLDLDMHTVTLRGEEIVLTLKEFELLELFMQNIGHAFTREQLLEKIWEEEYLGGTRTIDVHVGTLRTKLKDYGDSIQTVRGVGYRMEPVQ